MKGEKDVRWKVTRAADIAAEPGMPLSAQYWTQRNPGEGYADWQRRQKVQEQLDLARQHMDRAQKAMQRARELMGESNG